MIATLTGAMARLMLELLLTFANVETPIDTEIMIILCDIQTYVARIL